MAEVALTSNRNEWINQATKVSRTLTDQQVVNNLTIMLKRRWQQLNRRQIESEGSRGAHGAWPSLDANYAKQKRGKYPGKKMLRKTDKLWRAAVSDRGSAAVGTRTGRGYSFRYLIISPRYAKFHQEGDGVPQRRIYDPTKQQQRGITAAIGRTIVDGLFSRVFFDNRRRSGIGIILRNTGFDRVDI